MGQKKLNSGVIFTNSKCIGCNKCISGCIAVGANVVVKNNATGLYVVMVDPQKCILCGHCVKECVHKARTYRDDTDQFFADLKKGESISILVASSLITDYEKIYNNILGYLKHLGVQHVYNTSFGADIMVWIYMNFIHSFGLSGVISQFCPVIVNYIEKYKPELLTYLMPVQSPMMCTAIYASDYLGIKDKIAYISPCIASKYEIDDVNTYKKVSYNVTFERLMEHILQVDISNYYAEDEISYGLGALVSSAGGLSNNMKPYIGFNKVLIQTSGYSNIFPYFDHYAKEFSNNGELPFLVDVLSCTNGCDFGTGTNCGVEKRNEITFSAHRVKENAYLSGNVPTALNYEERLELLNKRFEKLELSSFVRQYSYGQKAVLPIINSEEIDAVYVSMYKETWEQKHTDCGACGYKTCYDMAFAIGCKVNHKENCINYSKECIRIETEKTKCLLQEISSINEELKKSTKMKSNFLANMSHEIRTPMNAVIGMAEMALRGNLPIEERGYIQQISASGRSLLAIINDILDFSKIESGKMEINETNYEVMSLINDTVNIIMTRIAEKDITLIVNADADIPLTLYGDDIRIKQVMVNFANNAVKFTESGFVEIILTHERYKFGIYLTVTIKDSGVGIKEDDLEKLFTSFQQVDSKRNRNIEGTGLGLVIAREFVRLMNGKINVESTYGVGSSFSFTIPQKIIKDVPCVSLKRIGTIHIASLLSNQYVLDGLNMAICKFDVINTQCGNIFDLREAIKMGAEFIFIDCQSWTNEVDEFIKTLKSVQTIVIVDPRKDIVTANYVRKLNQPVYSLSVAAILNCEAGDIYCSAADAQEIKFEAPEAQILIVDDNTINLTVAKGLLSPLHMQITTASGALEAIALIEKNKYDIVLMDHMMPEIDGIEATHIIRSKEDSYYKKLPIIALTANAINNAKEMFLKEGMNDFIAKPIEMADISAKIKKWLPSQKVHSIRQVEVVDKKPEKILLEIEGVDVQSGIELSGNMELYKTILADYYDVIQKKADLIEKYEAEEDIPSYTIEVHALKSASKLIGAIELSELAAKLEACGHNKDIAVIKAETPFLLQSYRDFIPRLAPYARVSVTVVEKAVDSNVVEESLLSLLEALDNFDLDAATAIGEELKSFQLDEKTKILREKLLESISNMEYDEAEEIVGEWRELLSV